MTQDKKAVGLKDPSSQKRNPKKKQGIGLSEILRNWRRGKETLLTGDEDVDQIIEALREKPVEGIDFVVKDKAEQELYRFHFLGPGRAPVPLGSKWGKTLVGRACPECGTQPPVMVIVLPKEEGRRRAEQKEATIHCGRVQIFE